MAEPVLAGAHGLQAHELSKQEQSKLESIRSELRAIRAQQDREKRLPQCPVCGGRLGGQFRKCKHCTSEIVWRDGLPCEPGKEAELLARLEVTRKEASWSMRWGKSGQKGFSMSLQSSGQIDNVMKEERLFPPPGEFAAKARIGSMAEYEKLCREAAEDLEGVLGPHGRRTALVRAVPEGAPVGRAAGPMVRRREDEHLLQLPRRPSANPRGGTRRP